VVFSVDELHDKGRVDLAVWAVLFSGRAGVHKAIPRGRFPTPNQGCFPAHDLLSESGLLIVKITRGRIPTLKSRPFSDT